MEATTVISGRLRPTGLALGTVGWKVVALKSVGATTTTYETVFQFVAFGIKSAGLWGGLTL